MFLIPLLGLALAAASTVLIARAAVMPRIRTSASLGRIGSYGFAAIAQPEETRGRRARSTLDGVAVILGAAAGRFGSFRESSVRRELVAAGIYGLAPRKFVGYRILCALSLLATWLWFASGGYSGGITALGMPVTLLIGWTAPMTIVRRRSRRRFEQIDYELPNLIDLLVTTVEAGLGFTGSLQLAAERFGGPLGDELRLTLQEQSMGLSPNEALRNLLERCDTPLMRSFVRTVLQGETLGISIGQIMRDLAVDMRKRRRQKAEERAQKAPIKLLFPLVFLIFPAMFVVILGPAVASFLKSFGGS